jgi:hypothetical protein
MSRKGATEEVERRSQGTCGCKWEEEDTLRCSKLASLDRFGEETQEVIDSENFTCIFFVLSSVVLVCLNRRGGTLNKKLIT